MSAGIQMYRDPADALVDGKFVIPVRYVAGGAVVQTTSTILQPDAIHVRSVQPPQAGRVLGLQLQFPGDADSVSVLGIVTQGTRGANSGFWAEFAGNDGATDRIAALLKRQRLLVERSCQRFHTHLAAVARSRGTPDCEGYVSNLSQTGAFVRLAALPAKSSIIELDVTFPEDPTPETVLAYVVHVAPRRGIGVQFVGAADEFRSRLDDHLARVANGLAPAARRHHLDRSAS